MIVQELIKFLQELPKEMNDAIIECEYRVYVSDLDMYGEPRPVDIDSIRIEKINGNKMFSHIVILY